MFLAVFFTFFRLARIGFVHENFAPPPYRRAARIDSIYHISSLAGTRRMCLPRAVCMMMLEVLALAAMVRLDRKESTTTSTRLLNASSQWSTRIRRHKSLSLLAFWRLDLGSCKSTFVCSCRIFCFLWCESLQFGPKVHEPSGGKQVFSLIWHIKYNYT
jgi:hypothetical protein